jgi:hypothetical protein
MKVRQHLFDVLVDMFTYKSILPGPMSSQREYRPTVLTCSLKERKICNFKEKLKYIRPTGR